MSDRTEDLSIIIPAKNEAATILPLLERMRRSFPLAEIIVVDNASTDETGLIATSMQDIVVVKEDLPGKGNAMRHGALTASRSVVMFHDADLEYDVADARSVAEVVLEAPVGERHRTMAIGVRAWRLHWLPVVSFGVNNLVRMLFWMRFRAAPEDVLTGTRCLTREAFLKMDTQSPSFAIETEITLVALKAGMNIQAMPVRYTPRKHSEGKKINWRHLLPILWTAVSRRKVGEGRTKVGCDECSLAIRGEHA